MPYLLVPSNLNMNVFGPKQADRDRVAYIFHVVYQGCMNWLDYNNADFDYSKPVPINHNTLRSIIKARPKELLNQIAIAPDNPKPPVPVLVTDGKYSSEEHKSKTYSFTEPYQTHPTEYKISQKRFEQFFGSENQRIYEVIETQPDFRKPSYKAVCEHIKKLTLEITPQQFDNLKELYRATLVEQVKNEVLPELFDQVMAVPPDVNNELPDKDEWYKDRFGGWRDDVVRGWHDIEQELMAHGTEPDRMPYQMECQRILHERVQWMAETIWLATEPGYSDDRVRRIG